VKSAMMQPSTIVRAHTELCQLTIKQKKAVQYVGYMLTDGGPEHNITFVSVKVALMILWLTVEFDELVVCRSCPQNSYTNEVERLMGVLNIGAYGIAVSRNLMICDDPNKDPSYSSAPDPSMNATLSTAMDGIVEGDEAQSSSSSSMSSTSALLSSVTASSESISSDSTSAYFEQRWCSSKNNKVLRERLAEDHDFKKAAMVSIGDVCEGLTKRFVNQVWDEKNIQRGCIAMDEDLKSFVNTLRKIDPGVGEFLENDWDKPDIFSSKLIKEQFAKKDGVYDFLATHSRSYAYSFSVKATCWHETAMVEIASGRDPDKLIGDTHPTCPYHCRRPKMSLTIFAARNFMASPDKDDSDTSDCAPFLPYSKAQTAVNKYANAGNKYVPTLTKVQVKEKWVIPPLNTKGEYIHTLFHFFFTLSNKPLNLEHLTKYLILR
jgi:hypothetical protein